MASSDGHGRPRLRAPLAQAAVVSLVFLVGAAACQWWLYLTADRVLRATVDEQLAQVARLAAGQIDASAHARIVRPRQLNGTEYRAIVAPLRRLRSALPHVRYIYTVRPGQEGPTFVVDAAPPLDTDEDGVLDQSAVGEVYESPDSAMLAALERGQPTVTEHPYTDRWGTFMSAYHPIRGSDGNLEAVVGVDVRAADYVARTDAMRVARDTGLGTASVFAVLLGILVFGVQRLRLLALADLELSESRFRSFFELGVVGMAVLDADERVVAANASLGALTARSSAELVGKRWDGLARPATRPAEGIRAVGADALLLEAEMVRRDGELVEVEVGRRAVCDAAGAVHHHVVLISDVGLRNRAQRELKASLKQSEAVLAAITAVTRDPAMAAGDVRAVAQILTPLAGAALDVDRSSVWRYSESASALICLDQFSRDMGRHASGQVLRRAELTSEFRALEAAPYVDAHDACTDARVAGLVESYIKPHGIRSMLDVRVGGSGRLLGVVCFEHVTRGHTWTAREIAMACQLADQIALVMLHSEARLAAETLREARDIAAAASRAKSQFLATMSHEIRTPINGVIGFTGLLTETMLTQEQHEYVGTIRSSGEALLTVINDILDFSKVEAGKLDIVAAPFALGSLVDEVTRIARPKSANVRVDVEMDPRLPSTVSGDAARVRQVLLNLLSNAVKFTPAGSVTVRLNYYDRGKVHFAVRDSGVGIPEAQRSRIFGEFSQADASTTRRFGGTGLGLAICKRLVELMGGEIGFSSREGLGSTFWFWLPLPEVLEPGAVPPTTPTEAAALGHHILVAEDNVTNQALMRRLLERLGCSVVIVSDGRTAVDAVFAAMYDLVLMDCQMPELDGIDATRAIRDREQVDGCERTPIIAVTASAMSGDRELCLAAGMDDYLTKPVRTDELRRCVTRWARSRGSSSAERLAAPARLDA